MTLQKASEKIFENKENLRKSEAQRYLTALYDELKELQERHPSFFAVQMDSRYLIEFAPLLDGEVLEEQGMMVGAKNDPKSKKDFFLTAMNCRLDEDAGKIVKYHVKRYEYDKTYVLGRESRGRLEKDIVEWIVNNADHRVSNEFRANNSTPKVDLLNAGQELE